MSGDYSNLFGSWVRHELSNQEPSINERETDMSKRKRTVGHSFDRENDTCECGGQWVYFDLDDGTPRGYGCEESGTPHVPALDTNGRPLS